MKIIDMIKIVIIEIKIINSMKCRYDSRYFFAWTKYFKLKINSFFVVG